MRGAWTMMGTWGLTVALLSGGCGDDEGSGEGSAGGPDGNDDPVPLDELCEVVEDRLCAALTECWGWDYRDMDHCRADQACWGFDVLKAAVDAGEVRYDPELVGQCRALYETEPCLYTFYFSIPTVDRMLVGCPYILWNGYGTRSVGESCMTALSCDRDSQCVFEDQCPGTCRRLAAEGEPCSDEEPRVECNVRDSLDCVDGTCQVVVPELWPCETEADCNGGVCNRGVAAIGVCDGGAREGEACDPEAGLDCGFFLACDTREGVCRPPAGDGQWCDDDLSCDEGLACFQDGADPDQNACGSPRAGGEPCTEDDHCASDHCDTDDTCRAKVGEGQPCSSGGCLEGLDCQGGVCVAPAFPGDACSEMDDRCAQSTCDGSTCQLDAPLGGACQVDDDCTSDACIGGVCVDPNTCG